jgi:hypothetical protein
MKSRAAAPTRFAFAASLTAWALLAGCTEKLQPPTMPAPGTAPGAMRPVIPDSVQTVFTDNCAVSGCHVAGSAFAQEILDADSSYAKTVGVPASQVSSLLRIRPGDPDNSYLVMKVTGAQGILGQQMPRGLPPLAPSLQLRIINWVAAGAPADSIPADSSRLAPRPLDL